MSNEVDADEIQRRGLMLVLSSPSGAGKTTLSRQLLDNDKQIQLSVSATTRARRSGERDGIDYQFVDTATFSGMVERGEFLEHARVFDHFYGTPRAPVEAALMAGRDVLFDIDWQGTQQLKEKAGSDLVTVFILPPSTRDLERRLITRAQDSMEVVQKRMAKAADEMSHWAEYDYQIINRDIATSLMELKSILTAERLKRERQVGLSNFVKALREGR
ncbi:guanylate kinase [Reyranella sp.]|jgi:guanylate kinase|uniref:guanylate kinase n=1 Tax=Reyranella sp. TaxID=1929291 RepID=UPI000BCAF726|nr:guanylate kinase [Reyranella sp.]OYY46167.1 MAG: guanylate kinase [Rhodospirillales bacterium 35-66-84]OYZ96547.1 MAG: guanylate kinase [Rhodospirillales bacterium 24-66-33]OZB28290.1 MAG: guanylate kinase [Rhodospirillales bacterium 39-66-50]HQS14512.1 guanylate kinase [Reyranella sp.]HQT11509.1 guanylate kinase [Reyranella sp.]